MKQEWEAYWDDYRFPDHFMWSDIEPFGNASRVLVAELSKNGSSILDVGCASCISYPLFKGKMEYVGMDFTIQFLKSGRKRDPTVPTVCGTALTLPFKDGAFDSAFIKDVFEHTGVDAFKAIIKEMWRVAKTQIILIFYGILRPQDTRYNQIREPDEANVGVPPFKGGLYYFNHYNKQEIIDAILKLENVENFEVINGIPREKSTPEDKGRTAVVVRKKR